MHLFINIYECVWLSKKKLMNWLEPWKKWNINNNFVKHNWKTIHNFDF